MLLGGTQFLSSCFPLLWKPLIFPTCTINNLIMATQRKCNCSHVSFDFLLNTFMSYSNFTRGMLNIQQKKFGGGGKREAKNESVIYNSKSSVIFQPQLPPWWQTVFAFSKFWRAPHTASYDGCFTALSNPIFGSLNSISPPEHSLNLFCPKVFSQKDRMDISWGQNRKHW